MGAPRITLNATHYEAARDMASRGISRAMIAQHFGFSIRAFHAHISRDTVLRCALERGDAEDVLEITNVYREKALAGSYQHGDRYLFLQHAIRSQGEAAAPAGGVTIHVTLPFNTGREGWKDVIDGDTVPNDTALIHEGSDT